MIASAQDQLVGRTLGEFVLRERIGEGGFGAVYRAVQPALDREAVVKVLHAKLHASEAATERFLREAKLASKLDHPYAAHIYAFGAERDGELWIAMELVRGTPLDQLLKHHGPLELERFVPLLDRICEVVHTAHEQGIVHRDLKPANVMVLARAGRLLPKLLDFGIAKGLASAEASPVAPAGAMAATVASLELDATPAVLDITQRGAIIGSPPYMAPEQWVDAGRVDARTDLYALGVLAYECLTGKPPFLGANLTQIARAHASSQPAPLGARFPAALDKVFAKVLAKRADDRYGDALAFAAAFRQASGIAAEAVRLPAIDAARRDAALTAAPQPIAEAVAAIEAARNAHHARDEYVQLARTITRYLGLLALACRSRVSTGSDPSYVVRALRTLYRRSLTDLEWLELARHLTAEWVPRRDAYPIPELVDCFHSGKLVEELEALSLLRERDAPTEDALAELLESAAARTSRVLAAVAFLGDYPLVLMRATGLAERWMGVQRSQRTTLAAVGKGLPLGMPALLDGDGAPVLSLSPIFQITSPSPGAPLDLFMFEGRDARGAKLVALPAGYEHHDDELWEWFRAQLAGSLDEAEATVVGEATPYRGLSAFSSEDGASFFGREKQIDAFSNRLKTLPLLAVVGRSGAGKSSFVHAGVVPGLAKGWRTIAMRPGAAPLTTLIARLHQGGVMLVEPVEGAASTTGARRTFEQALQQDRGVLGDVLREDAAARGPLLLVIDQLEEMFTLCQDDAERRAFAEALAGAARAADDPVRVVFTLRDDFLVRTEQVPALRNRIAQGLQLLTVPDKDDLLRILIEPARRAGYEFEDAELPAQMVENVAEQPGALALLSFTASKLWELRDRHFKQLTRSAYKLLGGVGGALAKHADATLDQMQPEERLLARDAFRHLVTSQNTRAVLRGDELRQLLGGSEHAQRVIEALVAARLLVASKNEEAGETIEIVHEALLVAWPRLVEWRREDAEGARFREQLRTAARQWDERGRAKGLLWRGDALTDYARWRARHPGPLTDLDAAFAVASEADAARGRRNRMLLVAATIGVLVLVVAGLVVFNARIDGQRQAAQKAANDLHQNLERQFEEQGRRLVLAGDPLQGLAYLAKADEYGAAGTGHDLAVAQAVRDIQGELFDVQHDARIARVQFSPDGEHFITASDDKTARIWNARTGALELSLAHGKSVRQATFSPDGTRVATAAAETVTLWDAHSGAKLHEIRSARRVGFSWAPDGSFLVVASWDKTTKVIETESGDVRLTVADSGSGDACGVSPNGAWFAVGASDGALGVWNARDGSLVAKLKGHGDGIIHLEFSPDSKHLVTASKDGTAIEWDVAAGRAQHVLRHRDLVWTATFSPDGAHIATASNDGTARIWDASTGDERMSLSAHKGAVRGARYSPDGRQLVTISNDATVRLWDPKTGRPLARLLGHRDTVLDVAFDVRSQRIVTASEDARAIVWSTEPQKRAIWLVGHAREVASTRFAHDGKRVATASWDGTARIWDVATGAQLVSVGDGQKPMWWAELSPDGTKLATAGNDGTVRIWDAASGAPLHVLSGHTHRVSEVVWSPDGSRLASIGDDDGRLALWSADGTALASISPHHGTGVTSVAFTPSGTAVATTGFDHHIRFWDVRTQAQLADFDDPDQPSALGFDRTGQRAISVTGLKVKLWDAATGKLQRMLVGHIGQIFAAVWSADGQLIVTGSLDGTARVWEAETGDTVALLEHGRDVWAVDVSRDRTKIVTGARDGTVAIHELANVRPSATDLDALLRCRVPFRVENDHLVSVPLDPAACRRPR